MVVKDDILHRIARLCGPPRVSATENDVRSHLAFLGLSVGAAPLSADEIPVQGSRLPLETTTLTKSIVHFFYPLFLANWHVALALRSGREIKGRLLFRAAGGPTIFEKTVTLGADTGLDEWTTLTFQAQSDDEFVAVMQPGLCRLWLEVDSVAVQLGRVTFAYRPAPDLTEDERDGLLANPTAHHAIALKLEDRITKQSIVAYCALDRSLQPDFDPNAIWYRDLPDEFPQSVGPPVPLRYLRESMHGLLRTRLGGVQGRSLYSAYQVQRILERFCHLIAQDVSEEEVQNYIEQNPILLAPFAPSRVFRKPPILNKYRADFGLLSSKSRLTLVEIERPSMKLFTKSGKPSGELQTPLDQVRSWFREVDRDRAGVLYCIPNCPREVSSVDGCVIAGRSKPEEREFRLRYSLADGRIEFLTYDQLVIRVLDVLEHMGLWSPGLGKIRSLAPSDD